MVMLSFEVSHNSFTDKKSRRRDDIRLHNNDTLVFSERAFQTTKPRGGLRHGRFYISGILTRLLSFRLEWNANWWRRGVMAGWILKPLLYAPWLFFHSGIHGRATSVWILMMRKLVQTIMSILGGREKQRYPCFINRHTGRNTNSFRFRRRKLLWWVLKAASSMWETF